MKVAKQKHNGRMTRADKAEPLQRAAGVVMMNAGRVLLLRRAGEGIWGLPGGGIEQGETPIQAAIRECHEEVGFQPCGDMREISRSSKHGADYTTYLAHHDEQTEPKLNHEHEAAAWVRLDELHKYKMHPGIQDTLGFAFRQDAEDFATHFGRRPSTETEVAQAIREGELASPQAFENITFFDIRITGTGLSVRIGKTDTETGEKQNDEYVMRDPEIYLNDEFLARCNGLPVVIEHPDTDTLDSKEFSTRIIGTIVLPYIKGNEVWGIAKIYDAAAAKMMEERKLSTSPAVVFQEGNANKEVKLDENSHLLIEGKPELIDHIAIVPEGVWDKGGGPTGVKSTRADAQQQRSNIMAEMGAEEKAKKDAEGGDPLSQLVAMVGAMADDMKEMKAKMAQLEAAEAAEAEADGASSPVAEAPAAAPAAAPVAAPDNAEPSAALQDMAKRVDALEAVSKPREEGEEAKLADAQARADGAYHAHGKRAPAPMQGETLLAYRQRLASGLQQHSDEAKSVNIRSIADSATLEIVERRIYADAAAAAAKASVPAPGTLVRTVRKDATGREITEFSGDPKACWGMFEAQTWRVKRINTNPNALH